MSKEIASIVELISQTDARSIALILFALIGSFSVEQKKYIKLRDKEHGIQKNKNGCQFPDKHFCNGDYQVQVHHIIPQRWSKDIGYNADVVENGITLCEYSHQNLIHPDMIVAKREYRSNKRSYAQVFEKRDRLLQQGKKYWDDTWDTQMSTTVYDSEQKMKKKAV